MASNSSSASSASSASGPAAEMLSHGIVRMAITQLPGQSLTVPLRWRQQRRLRIHIAQVAFSFGWVACSYASLFSVVAGTPLTSTSDASPIVVNCTTGIKRESRSWVLARLLRDYEIRCAVDPRSEEDTGRAESLRIDVFALGAADMPLSYDGFWWSGWAVIVLQLAASAVPWILYGDWAIFLVTLAGTLLAALMCSLRQWTEEKFVTRKLDEDKVVALTRGNGSFHVMVFVGGRGAWDLESLATGDYHARWESRWICGLLVLLWTVLLLATSGIGDHTWFLICIGGAGMLQNLCVASACRDFATSGLQPRSYGRMSTIIGRRQGYIDVPAADVDVNVSAEDAAALEALAVWTAGGPPAQNTPSVTSLAVPHWLNSMARADGCPSWLESHTSAPTAEKSADGSGGEGGGPVVYGIGVHGALMELEKWMPKAGLSLLPIFFEGGLRYNDHTVRDNVCKQFWRRAYAMFTRRAVTNVL
ncbi:hypothetical protein SCUCBS95973_009751 [Sporothrix curviconia]|uniref:Integral membrane protein n=1 Tax=Sporothrix curviconia TaxID=1260050 RepID=A0ABP0D146_9PEZI